MGYRRHEEGESLKVGERVTEKDDPYPVSVYGEDRPVPDSRIGRYMDGDFFFYNGVAEKVRRYGLPYPSWLDAPQWLLELCGDFERVDTEWENWKTAQAHGRGK